MASVPRQQLFFTRVKLTNWRNFRSAEVRLQRRAFFVGPNASGKSNILDALRFLRDIVSVGGGLQAAVQSRGNMLGVRCLFARRPPYVEIEADIGDASDSALWTYRLRFNKDKTRDRPVIEEEEVRRSGEPAPLVRRPIPDDVEDKERLSQTFLEQTNENRQFREIVEFFKSIRYLHVVPQIVRDARRHIFDQDDPFGGDLLARIAGTAERTRTARLGRIAEALKVAVPQFENLTVVNEDGRPHLEAAFRHWRPNPTLVREEKFSDGTLRLIGLLWSISEHGGPLLLEEPELSLNDEIVRALGDIVARMQRQSGRQVLITTHSEALLSSNGIATDETHILRVTRDGTVIETARDNEQIGALVGGGLTVGEAVLPHARPPHVDLFTHFDVAG